MPPETVPKAIRARCGRSSLPSGAIRKIHCFRPFPFPFFLSIWVASKPVQTETAGPGIEQLVEEVPRPELDPPSRRDARVIDQRLGRARKVELRGATCGKTGETQR